MIRYWIYRSTTEPMDFSKLKKEVLEKNEHLKKEHVEDAYEEVPAALAEPVAKPKRRVRVVRRGLYMLIASILALAASRMVGVAEILERTQKDARRRLNQGCESLPKPWTSEF